MIFGGFVSVGGGIAIISGWNKASFVKEQVLKDMPLAAFFPIFLPLSPWIYLFLKIQSLLRPGHEYIKKQAKTAAVGESMLEAAPQYCLQLYVVLSMKTVSASQLLVMITSALSLSIATLDKFLSNVDKQLGPNAASGRCFIVLLLHAIFKVMSFSICCVVFDLWTLFVIMMGSLIIILCNGILSLRQNINSRPEEWKQFGECLILGWLTVTNMEDTKTAKTFRMVSAYVWFVVYSTTLLSKLIFANTQINATLIPIADDTSFLNCLLAFTVGVGLMSLVIDLLYSFCDWETIFHQRR